MKSLPVVAAFVLAVVACSSTSDRQLLVSAAASLTDVFARIESAYEAEHPGADVALNLGSSAALREQILEGAPTDVFASADLSSMDQLADAVVGAPIVFATNRLQIAVPTGNPAHVTGLDDFASEDLLLGLCAVGVPCGDFARQVLEKAGVSPSIDTNEPDVRALLSRIEEGELDAAITYVTDVLSSDGSVEGVDIPDELNVIVEYPIATLAGAPNPDAAGRFVAFVVSEHGRAILAEHGFGPP